jgi:hypothetical protein
LPPPFLQLATLTEQMWGSEEQLPINHQHLHFAKSSDTDMMKIVSTTHLNELLKE